MAGLVLVLATGCLAGPALAFAARPGNYAASRFDVNVTVVSGGSLDVTETITFEFQSGTFETDGRSSFRSASRSAGSPASSRSRPSHRSRTRG
jgi:hypothetical protein